jgi:exosome complex RNA-binding protein Rrp4
MESAKDGGKYFMESDIIELGENGEVWCGTKHEHLIDLVKRLCEKIESEDGYNESFDKKRRLDYFFRVMEQCALEASFHGSARANEPRYLFKR